MATARAGAANPERPPAAISPRELRARVSPAVVALVGSRGQSPPGVATGVLVTASGLVLTSRNAIATAADGATSIVMVRAGRRVRISARELAEAVPVRVVALSDDLDLALVEALPAETVVYPHLPIRRNRLSDGEVALGIGHHSKSDKNGKNDKSDNDSLWSASTAPVGAPLAGAGAGQWMRTLPDELSAVAPGSPLVDGIGRVIGLVVESPESQGRVAVDAEGLLRFLLAANAPELRFAGVSPFRRPAPGEVVTAKRSGTSSAKRAAPARQSPPQPPPRQPPLEALAPSESPSTNPHDLPGIVRKGALDRQFFAGAASQAAVPADSAAAGGNSKRLPATAVGEWAGAALHIPLSRLDQHPIPATVQLDTANAPERGPRDATIIIVELGDYHAPETRDAEVAVRALVEGSQARVRLLWMDADRGDGAHYHLPARAARAAGEQDAFWPMHDRLMRGTTAMGLDPARVSKLARELDLDLATFDAALSSEGLASGIETDADRAGRLPVLCTPSFLVNGRVVEGGSIAALALRAAIDEDQAVAEDQALIKRGRADPAPPQAYPLAGRNVRPGK